MRLLHTSDWHLGRTLHEKRRHDEHAAFLGWLERVLARERVDVLLVCGDIFDTIAPSNRSLQLYYEFLRHAVDGGCRHIVIIGGNHDAPSLLDAPRQVLDTLGIHVLGGATDPVQEVLLLDDREGKPALIVCAVPFLRDRDVREVVDLEHVDDKARRLVLGMGSHYREAGQQALRLRERVGSAIPIVFTGHLFAAGGKTLDGDGVRDLYVGTSAQVGADMFPPCADYVALGHLHVPQRVAGLEHIRYSGSPLPMGFSEAAQEKQVILVDLEPHALFASIRPIPVPVFQRLVRIEGELGAIIGTLKELMAQQTPVWVEVLYRGTLPSGSVRQQLQELLGGTNVELLLLRSAALEAQALQRFGRERTLEDLDEREVFRRRLDDAKVSDEERKGLVGLFEAIVHEIRQEAAE